MDKDGQKVLISGFHRTPFRQGCALFYINTHIIIDILYKNVCLCTIHVSIYLYTNVYTKIKRTKIILGNGKRRKTNPQRMEQKKNQKFSEGGLPFNKYLTYLLKYCYRHTEIYELYKMYLILYSHNCHSKRTLKTKFAKRKFIFGFPYLPLNWKI